MKGSDSKPHYLILDGLRGVAAILVVLFHLLEAIYPRMSDHPLHHGYLAVDFFFMLSGFVVAHAYDSRWPQMSTWEFFRTRLIRLHPLVVLSVVIGAVCFWFDPYANTNGQISLAMLLGIVLAGFTLLPTPDVHGWGETHSLNGPLWSLLQEYLANGLYVLTRRLGSRGIWTIAVIGAIVLVVVAENSGGLATGWSYNTFWKAPVRMLFPFFAGLLLYRSGKRIKVPWVFPLSSLVLVIVFCLPTFEYNGLYDALCIIFVFPLIVAAGAGGGVEGKWAKVTDFTGAISYPVYIVHYPFIYIYTMWVYTDKPAAREIALVASVLFVLFIALAYVCLKWYDEPVRRYLRSRTAR